MNIKTEINNKLKIFLIPYNKIMTENNQYFLVFCLKSPLVERKNMQNSLNKINEVLF